MNKKGQLSIETLILYGLIVLVALSAVGALIYFDVLDLGGYLPDTCDLGGKGDLKCEEMQFSGTTLSLGVRNTGQRPIESITIYVEDEEGTHFSGIKSADATGVAVTTPLAPGDIAAVKIDVGGSNPGKVLRGSLKAEYKFKDGAITQESAGNIRITAGI